MGCTRRHMMTGGLTMRPFRSLLVASTLSSVSAIMYYKGLNTVVDLEALDLIKDGKATKPLMLSFSNPSCVEEQTALGFPFEFFDIPDTCYEMVQVQYDPETDNELTEFFKPSGCDFFAFLGAEMPMDKFETLVAESSNDLNNFFWDRHRYSGVKLVNDLKESVDIKWEKRFELSEHAVATMAPGQAQVLDTFRGHTFIFRTTEEGNLLARKVITSRKELLMSDLVLKECGKDEADCERPDTETLQRTQHQMNIWRSRLSTNIGRLRQNEDQPPRLEHYAPVGFKKITVPEPAWSTIQAFYQANKDKQGIREPWDEGDTHVNFYESGTSMKYISEDLRQLIFNTLRPVLEGWVGGMKLDPTSCYGIRVYTNGSWLRDHVDIGETHIVSAIINVAQDVDKDWPLMILDHEGNRHMINMQPGDLVLYESATKIHGRPQPLSGREYANVFVHYRPLSWTERDRIQDIQDEEENDFVEQL